MRQDRELEAYFNEAASWDADRAALNERDTRRAWSVAAAGWICALLAGIALVVLLPLKRVDPFVVRVDNASGVVDVVPVYTGAEKASDLVTRYLLDHYITVCERFNFATAESDYEECGAFHTAQGNQAWYARWNRGNPASPLNIYKDGTTLRAQVRSVSFFSRADGTADLAQVRYAKVKRSASGAEGQPTYWIATVQYAYGKPSTDPKVRRWNPLGFKVVDFHPEPETPTELETSVPPTGKVANLSLTRQAP